MNAIQKLLSALNIVLKRPHEAFKGFGSGYTDLHVKLDADTLLDSAIHPRLNETQSQKSTCVKTI